MAALIFPAVMLLSPAFVQPAAAQVRLPGVQLPQLPLHSVQQTLGTLESGPALNDPTQLRALRVRDLLRRNRRELDTDRRGEAVVRGQVIAIAPSDAALAAARTSGFETIQDRQLAELALRYVVLRAPANTNTRKAVEQLRRLDPSGSYDFNHVFDASGTFVADGGAAAIAENSPKSAERPSTATGAAPARRVGLIDSGVDLLHPVFRQAVIHPWGCDGQSIPAEHGTEVASLLVGDAGFFKGAAPRGELFAADVYCGRVLGGAADAIVNAFAWMAQQRVAVINVSLVGPDNRLLARAIEALVARGYLIVAAVGNDGPASPPLYPAAYAGVVGVTAVDERNKVLLEAGRGPQVSFSAPGAQMLGAAPSAQAPSGVTPSPRSLSAAQSAQAPSAVANGAYRTLRGTSFAAPIVAGLLAMALATPEAGAAHQALAALVANAVDLGVPGRDSIYGAGLVGAAIRVPPSAFEQ